MIMLNKNGPAWKRWGHGMSNDNNSNYAPDYEKEIFLRIL
jgi:hypothetical protein